MKMAQRTTQKLSNTPANAPEAPLEAPESTEGENQSIRTGTSLFALVAAGAGQSMHQKVAFMGDIRQKLAQVADQSGDKEELTQEIEGLAASAATRLFLARKNGMISGDELSGLLGDVFGYVEKKDGSPGKTPAGAGATIRKRVVRALQGWDFVNGGDGGRFFETMDKDEVAPIINSIGRVKKVEHTAEDGTVTEEIVSDGPTVWAAYKTLGDLKSQSTVRVEMAFDPKKIAALGDKLIEAGARDKLLSNPSLIKAYKYLSDQITAVSQVSEGELEAVKARLGIVSDETENETEEEDGEQVAA
jgi:hypothetical protein